MMRNTVVEEHSSKTDTFKLMNHRKRYFTHRDKSKFYAKLLVLITLQHFQTLMSINN